MVTKARLHTLTSSTPPVIASRVDPLFFTKYVFLRLSLISLLAFFLFLLFICVGGGMPGDVNDGDGGYDA